MLYKTIVLELIQDRPELYERLKGSKALLPAIERYAGELKSSQERWKKAIASRRPGSDANQIASEAMELAIEDLARRLPSASPADEAEPLSLDAAMAYLRRHTLTG